MPVAEQLDFIGQHVGEAHPDKCNEFTEWQTDGAWHCAEFCASGAQEAAAWGGYNWPEDVGCQWGTKGDAYCPWIILHARALGLWHPRSDTPTIGMQVLYCWGSNGVADHVGTLAEVFTDGSFVAGEFNAGGGSIRWVHRDLTYVLGFVDVEGLPHASWTPPTPPTPEPPLPGNPPLDFATFQPHLNWTAVQPYPYGVTIEVTQAFLNSLDPSYAQLVTDGVYGPATRSRVVQFQQVSSLQPDGVVGPVTATALHDLAVARGWSP